MGNMPQEFNQERKKELMLAISPATQPNCEQNWERAGKMSPTRAKYHSQ
ncbi:MAG: hypothetical protein ABR954_09910 [Dehalococcoidales bacterium]